MRILHVALLVLTLQGTSAYGQSTVTTQFDSTKGITLTGVVAGIAQFRDRSYLVLDVKTEATGTVERWAILGNDRNTLAGAGWRLAGLVPQDRGTTPPVVPYRGETITVAAFRPKADIDIQTILGGSPAEIGGTPEGLSPDSPFARLARGDLRVDLREVYKNDRLVYGTEVQFSDGTTLWFGRAIK